MGRRRNGGRGRGRGDRRTQKRDFREKRENQWRREENPWSDWVLENEQYETYYKDQGFVPEGEWDNFLGALKRQLPVTFRINGRGPYAEALGKRIARLCEEIKETANEEGKEGEAAKLEVKPFVWYPEELAWGVDASRSDLRKIPSFKPFFHFLKTETELGGISRQEAVSMIPPLFLDVQPHHTILDVCASPGSKTFQLMEMLHSDPVAPPTGLLVANDCDFQRCNLLTHQIKRMCSPNIMITTHDGCWFPTGRRKCNENILEFDRILCDVPCSGDATLRKSPDIWKRWKFSQGNSTHIQQLRITLRASQMLKVGGRIVYSTCSFNPIENEAVVAEVIRRTEGAMELVDVSDQLPNLKRIPGMKTWKVRDEYRYYDDYEACAKHRRDNHYKIVIDPTMFPDKESDKMPLERCMRLLPHHSDTGGFFVAALQKVKKCPVFKFPNADHRWEDCTVRDEKHKDMEKGGGEKTTEKKNEGGDQPEAVEKNNVSKLNDSSQKNGDGKAEEKMPVDGNNEIKDEEMEDVQNKGGKSEQEKESESAPPQQNPQGPSQAARSVKPEEEEKDQKTDEKTEKEKEGGIKKSRWKGVDPIFTLDDHWMVKSIEEFYGVDGNFFARHLVSRAMVNDAPRRVYLVSESVRKLIDRGVEDVLQIQSLGQKVLERHEHRNSHLKCIYRFCQEGLPVILNQISKQKIFVTLEHALRLLEERSLPLPKEESTQAKPKQEETEVKMEESVVKMEENEGKDGKADAQQDPRKPIIPVTEPYLLDQLQQTEDGGCVVLLQDEVAKALNLPLSTEAIGGLTAKSPFALACWKTQYRLNMMVSKQEAAMLIDRLREVIALSETSTGKHKLDEQCEDDAGSNKRSRTD